MVIFNPTDLPFLVLDCPWCIPRQKISLHVTNSKYTKTKNLCETKTYLSWHQNAFLLWLEIGNQSGHLEMLQKNVSEYVQICMSIWIYVYIHL